MFDRKRTKAQEKSYSQLIRELNELEWWHRDNQLKLRTLPKGWRSIEQDVPVRPRKTRITAALDRDLVAWFRAMGHGHQARMNAVLRLYMLAVLSKEIEGRGDRDWKWDPI
jgi:uncharacterized protein (DUF4415 family)